MSKEKLIITTLPKFEEKLHATIDQLITLVQADVKALRNIKSEQQLQRFPCSNANLQKIERPQYSIEQILYYFDAASEIINSINDALSGDQSYFNITIDPDRLKINYDSDNVEKVVNRLKEIKTRTTRMHCWNFEVKCIDSTCAELIAILPYWYLVTLKYCCQGNIAHIEKHYGIKIDAKNKIEFRFSTQLKMHLDILNHDASNGAFLIDMTITLPEVATINQLLEQFEKPTEPQSVTKMCSDIRKFQIDSDTADLITKLTKYQQLQAKFKKDNSADSFLSRLKLKTDHLILCHKINTLISETRKAQTHVRDHSIVADDEQSVSMRSTNLIHQKANVSMLLVVATESSKTTLQKCLVRMQQNPLNDNMMNTLLSKIKVVNDLLTPYNALARSEAARYLYHQLICPCVKLITEAEKHKKANTKQIYKLAIATLKITQRCYASHPEPTLKNDSLFNLVMLNMIINKYWIEHEKDPVTATSYLNDTFHYISLLKDPEPEILILFNIETLSAQIKICIQSNCLSDAHNHFEKMIAIYNNALVKSNKPMTIDKRYLLVSMLIGHIVTISDVSLLFATALEKVNVSARIIYKVIEAGLKFNKKGAIELLRRIHKKPESDEHIPDITKSCTLNEQKLNELYKLVQRKCFDYTCNIFNELKDEIHDRVTKIHFDEEHLSIALTAQNGYESRLTSAMSRQGFSAKSTKNIVLLEKISNISKANILAAINETRKVAQTQHTPVIQPNNNNDRTSSIADDSPIYYSHKKLQKRNPNSKSRGRAPAASQAQALVAAPPTPVVKEPVVIDFGDNFPRYNSDEDHCQVVALSNNYSCGIYYAYIDPKLGLDICKLFDGALRGLGKNEGRIIPARNTNEGNNKSGAKFFKIDGQVKVIKLKIAGNDDFLKGDIVTSKLRLLKDGLTITCHLICYSRVENHKQEQRANNKDF